MHRSRLQVVLIDSPPDVAEKEVAFWSGALGRDPMPEAGTPFTGLTELAGGELLVHQRLEQGDARIHLDIETDHVAAEVRRLEGLGAVNVGGHEGSVHLRDPAGLMFCVVPVQSDDFTERATAWD